MTAAVSASAGMPLPLLLDKLERHAWPGLERRHAVMLRALAARLPHRSAEGRCTVEQLATCYSTRWTRETLAELESLGVITWHRGGVKAGRPQPSTFRVVKARLVELLRDGLVEFAQLVARRRAATAARIAGLGTSFPRRRRRSAHVEVRSDPTPTREVTGGSAAPVTTPKLGTGAPPPGLTAEIRRALRARRPVFSVPPPGGTPRALSLSPSNTPHPPTNGS